MGDPVPADTYHTGRPRAELFGWPEYLVFGIMLGISAIIGLYYGCVGKKLKTTKDFLMGGKNLGVFPVASSLIASFISAITLLGQPSEVYVYGTLFWMVGTSYAFMLLAAAFFYLPVFYELQLTSAYEYLELRFSRPLRLMASCIFTFHMNMYMAIVVYAPSLALSQVTGMNVYGCVVAIYTICTFYTTVGGLKAVVWTDTLQTIIMFGAMLVIIYKGVLDAGGFSEVWSIAEAGGRIEFFNFDLDPRTRHSVWGLFFGSYFMWAGTYGCNQAMIQRYLSLPSMKKAQWALFINFFGLIGILTISCYAGLVVYARYATCDPLVSERVTKVDQIFPLFVMDTVGKYPGLPGLFVAGVFSGTLSTVSTGLNSLAAITLEDFIKGIPRFRNISDETATKLSKFFAVFYGCTSFGLVFIAAQLGAILQASISVAGTLGGPIFGLFTLGMFVPWCSKKGALIGMIVALIFSLWLCIGANIAKANSQIVYPKLPVSVEGCTFGNFTKISSNVNPEEVQSGGLIEFYRISYIWYPVFSFMVTFIVGIVASFITGSEDLRTINPKLISPAVDTLMRWILPEHVLKAIGWTDIGAQFKSKEPPIQEMKPLNVKNYNGPNGRNYVHIS